MTTGSNSNRWAPPTRTTRDNTLYSARHCHDRGYAAVKDSSVRQTRNNEMDTDTSTTVNVEKTAVGEVE